MNPHLHTPVPLDAEAGVEPSFGQDRRVQPVVPIKLRPRVVPGLVQGLLGLALGLAWLTGALGQDSGESTRFKEEQVKAAFIYNFTKFVEWRAEKLGASNLPIVVGVAGATRLKEAVAVAVERRMVADRTVEVRTVTDPQSVRELHVLVLGAEEDGRVSTWLEEAVKTNVLTIGETEAFGRQGGMIVFVWQGNRIRFEINVAEADRAGLRISAQLQKLALRVRKRT